jgi:hypothetical protein
VPKRLGWNKRKEFEFEIQTLQYLIYEPNLRVFPSNFRNTNELLFKHYSCYSDTRGVTALPPNRNLVPRFGRSNGYNRNSEQSHNSSLWQDEVWMVRTEEGLTFPSCFFFRVVAPLYLEELDCFTPRNTILLIQDLDSVLRV